MPDRVVRQHGPLAVGLVLAAAAVAFTETAGLATRPVERVALVTVVAEAGSPIRDLTAAEFVVKEDGKKREVSGARLATDQLNVALLLDVAQPPRGAALPTKELRTAATAFVTTIHGFNPDARIALWPWQQRRVRLRLYASPSLNVTVLALSPTKARSAARRRFLRVGNRVMNELRDRLDAAVDSDV